VKAIQVIQSSPSEDEESSMVQTIRTVLVESVMCNAVGPVVMVLLLLDAEFTPWQGSHSRLQKSGR
jgi:hypothetical protein